MNPVEFTDSDGCPVEERTYYGPADHWHRRKWLKRICRKTVTLDEVIGPARGFGVLGLLERFFQSEATAEHLEGGRWVRGTAGFDYWLAFEV